MTGRLFGYVYNGHVRSAAGQTLTLDGMAWSPQRCDESRLRAAALRELSRTKDVPLSEVEITQFWYSEIETTATRGDTVDPFSP